MLAPANSIRQSLHHSSECHPEDRDRLRGFTERLQSGDQAGKADALWDLALWSAKLFEIACADAGVGGYYRVALSRMHELTLSLAAVSGESEHAGQALELLGYLAVGVRPTGGSIEQSQQRDRAYSLNRVRDVLLPVLADPDRLPEDVAERLALLHGECQFDMIVVPNESE